MIDRNPTIDVEDKKGKALSYVRGQIEFKEIHFSYPSRPDSPILQGLNLKIPASKTVGLVGGSGSGKSTIMSLIQRFYDPKEGEILLDGYKIEKLHLKWFRSQMGLVNQEPILFATSIKENILFGKEGATFDDVVAAAKDANAHDFILKFPDGYETNVSSFLNYRKQKSDLSWLPSYAVSPYENYKLYRLGNLELNYPEGKSNELQSLEH